VRIRNWPTLDIRHFWQGNHRVYGHIRSVYTVLANPTYAAHDCLGLRSYVCLTYLSRVGQNIHKHATECYRIFYEVPAKDTVRIRLARTIYIYGVYTVFLAGKSPSIRSCTECVNGSGQPYICLTCLYRVTYASQICLGLARTYICMPWNAIVRL